MKTKSIILIVTILLIITSCSTKTYIQVYKTTPIKELTRDNGFLIYEDDNCKVSYNLWAEAGNIGFNFYNKTNQNIYLNMEESFFILNGIAHNYYKSRTITNSTASGTTALVSKYTYASLLQNTMSFASSSGLSVSYNEEKIIIIPSKASKVITEYNINETLYRDCDLFKYPRKKQIKSKNFSKADSPIVFSNRIAYFVGLTTNLIKFENEFYVSEISNYSEDEITESRYDEFCGQKNLSTTKYFKNNSPDKFYIRYVKGQDFWKH